MHLGQEFISLGRKEHERIHRSDNEQSVPVRRFGGKMFARAEVAMKFTLAYVGARWRASPVEVMGWTEVSRENANRSVESIMTSQAEADGQVLVSLAAQQGIHASGQTVTRVQPCEQLGPGSRLTTIAFEVTLYEPTRVELEGFVTVAAFEGQQCINYREALQEFDSNAQI